MENLSPIPLKNVVDENKIFFPLFNSLLVEKNKIVNCKIVNCKILFSSTTFFKGIALRFSINQSVEKEELKIVDRYKRKLDNLLQEKNSEDDLTENPNNIITNLSSHTLTEEEFEALRYGLKFGIATPPCESNILAYTEDIWEQISKSEICNVGKYNEARIKNLLRCLAFNIINIDEKRIFKDQKKIKLLKSLQKTITVLKPDKGNGIVLMDKSDYIHTVENIFSDSNKFKLITDDPTITRMKSLQNYL